MEQFWKVLNADGAPCHGGRGKWFLPSGGRWPDMKYLEVIPKEPQEDVA